MKITESKLRQMIRGVIREFVSTGTAAGAQRGGHQSAATKAKKSTYDAKKSTHDTKSSEYDAKAAESVPLQYRSRQARDGSYTYGTTKFAGGSVNPAYTTYQSDLNTKKMQRDTAERNKNLAKSGRDTAKTNWDSAKETDLQKTVPTQKPPSGGGAGFGKGKSAGKGKGKGKKKK